METNEETNVYEISYHLVPTLADDALSAEADRIKSLVEAEGGEVISAAAPELKALAYEISKTIKATKKSYSKAYFGWIKFEVAPEAVLKLKTALDASDNVLRYLIVSTVKESTLMADKEKRPARPEAAKEKEKETPITKDAEIDKSIDELVIN